MASSAIFVAFSAAIEDRAGRILARGLAAIAGLGDGIDIGAAGIHLVYMSASLPCISWNSPIGLAELLALVDVGHDDIHAPPA